MEIKNHNEKAWDLYAQAQGRWSIPIKESDLGKSENLKITPQKPLPKEWTESIEGKTILALAAGGGQQGPLLASLGAKVTVVDISKEQLEKDRRTAESYGLQVETLHTSADNLSFLKENSFDLIINPVSNCFFESLPPVWKECSRVLKSRGILIYAFNNPISYLFDYELMNKGSFHLKYSSPFSDTQSLNEEEKAKFLGSQIPLEYGHSLTDQISELLKKGFVLEDMYEDFWGDEERHIDRFFPQFIAVKARKL